MIRRDGEVYSIKLGHRVQFSFLSSVHSLFLFIVSSVDFFSNNFFCFLLKIYFFVNFLFCFKILVFGFSVRIINVQTFPNNKLPDRLLTRLFWRKISNTQIFWTEFHIFFFWTFFSIVLWFESAMNLWSFEYNFAFS